MVRKRVIAVGLIVVMVSFVGTSLHASRHGGFGDTPYPNMPNTNASINLPFNTSMLKNKWEEWFKHVHSTNGSDLQDKWKNWSKQWNERFNHTSGDFKGKWRNATRNFRRMKRNHSFIGRISYEDGYCVGNFVKFLFDSGDLIDYTAIRDRNITIFDFIHIQDFNPTSQPTIHGAVWRVADGDTSIEVHDNAVCLLKIKVESKKSVDLNLSTGVSVDQYRSNILRVSGEINGKIVLTGNGSMNVSNSTVYVKMNRGMLLFIASPLPEISIDAQNQNNYEEKIAGAIENGSVCARIFIQRGNETDSMIFSNSNIGVHTFRDRIEVMVNSTGNGKSIILDIGKGIFNHIENITVRLDNKTIPMAENYEDILYPEYNESAEYLIITGTNGLQILVSIPHFSIHSIEIEESPAGAVNNTNNATNNTSGGNNTGETGTRTPGFETYMLISALIIGTIAVGISRKRWNH